MTFDFEKIKHIVACPKCRGDLVHDGNALICTNPDQRLKFPILDEIPRLLADEADEISPEDWSAAMQRHGRDASTGRLLQEQH